jgi:hypothetical protein
VLAAFGSGLSGRVAFEDAGVPYTSLSKMRRADPSFAARWYAITRDIKAGLITRQKRKPKPKSTAPAKPKRESKPQWSANPNVNISYRRGVAERYSEQLFTARGPTAAEEIANRQAQSREEGEYYRQLSLNYATTGKPK